MGTRRGGATRHPWDRLGITRPSFYTCLVFTVRFLESSSRTPSTSARSHQRASRGEGPCACSLYYFLKWHNQPFTAEDAEDAEHTRRRICEATLHPGLIAADRIFSFRSA